MGSRWPLGSREILKVHRAHAVRKTRILTLCGENSMLFIPLISSLDSGLPGFLAGATGAYLGAIF